MQFYFTEEDEPTRERAIDIRAQLVHAHHEVRHGMPGAPAPPGTDVWFHGLAIEGAPPMSADVVATLVGSSAPVALFQLCDGANMSFERVPPELAQRTRLFLRNHWPRDESLIPEQFRGRLGFMPPMVKAMAADPGKPLDRRRHDATFFGRRTGFENLPQGGNAREEVVRRLRASGLPFIGGIVPHTDPRCPSAADVVVARMTGRQHDRLLRETKICVAPWGFHPITYRLFEGLALRCLVVAQTLGAVRFLDGGLEAGRHYVEFAADLHDLVDVVRYYIEHPGEAQTIADAGHEHFRRYLEARGRLASAWLCDATVASWGELYRPSAVRTLRSTVRSGAARLFPGRF